MTDFLSPLGFSFSCDLLNGFEQFVQGVKVPGLSIDLPGVPTPFQALAVSPDHMNFDTITVRFKVDKELNNYEQIFNWMQALTFPDNFNQRSDFGKLKGEGTLTFLDAQFNGTVGLKFEDVYPVGLSGWGMGSDSDGVEYVESFVTFKYTKFTFVRLKP